MSATGAPGWGRFDWGAYFGDLKVALLTVAQQGILVRLWAAQWLNGPLPADRATLLRICGTSAVPEDVEIVVSTFFAASPNGQTVYSARLESERKRATTITDNRTKANRKITKQRIAKHYAAKDLPASRNGEANGKPTADHSLSLSLSLSDVAVKGRKSKAKPVVTEEGWPAQVRAALLDGVGPLPYGRIGKQLEAAQAEYGTEALVKAATLYAAVARRTDPRYAGKLGLRDFAERVGYFVAQTQPMKPEDMQAQGFTVAPND